jgi:hypothetical protein
MRGRDWEEVEASTGKKFLRSPSQPMSRCSGAQCHPSYLGKHNRTAVQDGPGIKQDHISKSISTKRTGGASGLSDRRSSKYKAQYHPKPKK